jgi:predicted phosphodiesterase
MLINEGLWMLKTAMLYLVIAGCALAAYPIPAGLWLFDDSANLTQSVVGANLAEAGTHTAIAGISAGDGAVADPLGSYYICTHGIAANGGGIFVNQYTILLDVKYPASSAGQWKTLIQTNIANSNDGDCFINTTGTIGVAATGYSTNTLASETWARIVISVSNPSFYRIYVNGVKWKEGTAQALDGRFSLDPTVLFFADENGDDYPIHCTRAAIWGQALSDAQVSSLGGPANPVEILAAESVGFNLLTNPSGESGLSGWATEAGFDWQATDRTDWHFPHTGTYYLTAGRTDSGVISQIVNLAFMASDIDNGRAIAKAGGYLGGDNQDQGRIVVEYLDAADAVLGTSDSGWIATPNAHDWQYVALPDDNGVVIPAGTRSARYSFQTQRIDGADCDAFADDLFWEYRLAAAGNTDPATPSISASSTGTIGVNVAFTFASADTEADQVSYQVDWGNEVSNWSDFQASGANYIISHAWPTAGVYAVRSRCRDANGGLSAWSSPFTITITGAAAGVFKSKPYLQNVTQDAITIAWETDRMVYPIVDWGLTSAYGSQSEGLCINAGSGVYICKVRITGLAAQTLYHYKAHCGSTLDTDAVFKTAPNSWTPFTFAVWGDSQQETANPAVSSTMFTHMSLVADIGIVVGDVVQDSGYTYFANPFRKYLCNVLASQKPVFVAFGNHDEPQNSFVHKAIQNSAMQSFSFNYGNAHFTCIDYSQLNDNTLPYDDSISSLPLGWLQQDLASDAAQNAAWRFVFVHVPVYCERWFDGSSILRTYLVPLMQQYNVQICFSGHTHEYERGRLDGTYYVISGCGSYLDTVEPVVADWPHMTVGGAHNIGQFVGGCVNGYAKVDINQSQLTLTQYAYTSTGSFYGAIDTFKIRLADFTQDGSVDLNDLAVLSKAWQTTPQDADWNSACDLADRANRTIDISDLAVFVQYWQMP